MSKFTAALLVLCLLLFPALSYASDYSAMSDDELFLAINQMRSELELRNHNSEMIISQNGGITVYYDKATIEKSYDGTYTLTISVIAVNSGDKPEMIYFDKVCINGWEVITMDGINLDAGNKTKSKIIVYQIDEKAEIKTIDEIEDIEVFSYDPNDYNSFVNKIAMRIVLK